ncbi:hypothetical protein FGG08_005504 [Glutinoglossum americanum]|uniref:Uncharacterized protein n=1 Tax=Glutinoglossum americanum TaxID=1670608 RepID=A0A9P8I3G6_9PEZI|nr:hypothetical protein FGG08_005504 [Glutinoglossum americanum]
MPCLIVHSINWPTVLTDDVHSSIVDTADVSAQLSMSGDSLFSYVNYPGNAVLFDPTNATPKTPFKDSLSSSTSLKFGLANPVYPSPSKVSGSMTAIVLLAKGYVDFPFFEDGFGYAKPNNGFTTDSSDRALHLTYLEINFIVGMMTADTSTYISS